MVKVAGYLHVGRGRFDCVRWNEVGFILLTCIRFNEFCSLLLQGEVQFFVDKPMIVKLLLKSLAKEQ